jgi:DNA-binding CsgD family transcriptional regulator
VVGGITPPRNEGNQRCAAMHTIEVVQPLEMGPHCPVGDADTMCDLLVSLALGDQIDDRDLSPRQSMNPACRSTLVGSLDRELPFRFQLREPGWCWTRSGAQQTLGCPHLPDSPTDWWQRNCTFGQMVGNSARRQPSPRQQGVLDLLVRGMTNKEIGARLGISERGVKHHVSKLLALYGVEHRAGLIAIVLGRKR